VRFDDERDFAMTDGGIYDWYDVLGMESKKGGQTSKKPDHERIEI